MNKVIIVGGGAAGMLASIIAAKNGCAVTLFEKNEKLGKKVYITGKGRCNVTNNCDPEELLQAVMSNQKFLYSAFYSFTSQDMMQLLEDAGVPLKTERGNRVFPVSDHSSDIIHGLERLMKKYRVQIHLRSEVKNLLTENGRVYGAVGFSIMEETAYVIHAKAVLIATGGAAGLYKPNNPGFSRHKMWYPPFNTGAGYAMGIRCGAEMTTFEMRFIALRCKDTIAPTGTIAQGVQAKQVNSKGEVYEHIYGLTTSQRVYGTVRENQLGHGPCYLQTSGITSEQDQDLLKAYLNMAPSQTLKWIESGKMPNEQDVEIQGTEPYIVGGHTASGFWVDTNRETTIQGLFAAGDVAGGCPQKYVTGAMVEGEIAAIDMVSKLDADTSDGSLGTSAFDEKKALDAKASEYDHFLTESPQMFTTEAIEEAMQKVMDNYAGGISTHYQFNGKQLALAKEKINHLIELTGDLYASDMHELMFIYELKERLTVCLSVIAHLGARKETRWHSFAENLDYPHKSDDWMKYVNSRYENGQLHMIYRELVGREARYEHND